MRPKLILGLIVVMLIVRASLSDLPSCIRAKCVHCKVHFIAQMCPIACSSCPVTTQQPTTQQNTQQHFLTAVSLFLDIRKFCLNKAKTGNKQRRGKQ